MFFIWSTLVWDPGTFLFNIGEWLHNLSLPSRTCRRIRKDQDLNYTYLFSPLRGCQMVKGWEKVHLTMRRCPADQERWPSGHMAVDCKCSLGRNVVSGNPNCSDFVLEHATKYRAGSKVCQHSVGFRLCHREWVESGKKQVPSSWETRRLRR